MQYLQEVQYEAYTINDLDEYATHLHRALELEGIPEHMHEGVVLYAIRGMVADTGFLRWAMENNFTLAAQMSDQANAYTFKRWASLFNSGVLPGMCHGSQIAVHLWRKHGALHADEEPFLTQVLSVARQVKVPCTNQKPPKDW